MRSNGIALIALAAVLAAAGCHKKTRTPIVVIPPPSLPAPIPTSVPATIPGPEPGPDIVLSPPSPPVTLDEANRAFYAGSFEEAAREYETYLRLIPHAGQRDEALFRLGLSYALRPAPSTDWVRASGSFKQLIEEFPNSPYRMNASLILALRTELERASIDLRSRDQRIKQLTTELDRLKKIDANRTRRP